MNDGMYTNIRNYLEEIASTSKQLLEAQKRMNDLLEKQASGKPDKPKTAAKKDKPDKDDLPWPTYDTDSEETIIARLRTMPPDERNKALAYERKNRNRVTILRVNWNSFA